ELRGPIQHPRHPDVAVVQERGDGRADRGRQTQRRDHQGSRPPHRIRRKSGKSDLWSRSRSLAWNAIIPNSALLAANQEVGVPGSPLELGKESSSLPSGVSRYVPCALILAPAGYLFSLTSIR